MCIHFVNYQQYLLGLTWRNWLQWLYAKQLDWNESLSICSIDSWINRIDSSNREWSHVDLGYSLLVLLLLRENVPEAQCFVASPRDNSLPVRWHCHVEHTRVVTSQLLDLLHWGAFPNTNCVFTVAVSTDQLMRCLTEHNVTHLRFGVDWLNLSALNGVPEFDAAVCSSTTWCKYTALMWAPVNRLHCSSVRAKLMKGGFLSARTPNE